MVRKEWQNKKRKNCKSHTVFFTQSEFKELLKAIKGPRSSITGFIKQSSLHAARNSPGVDKTTLGQVRGAFFEAFNLIEGICKEEQKQVLQQFINLEQKVLKLLCH